MSSKEDQLDKQSFNLFEAIEAIDRKDYGYYDRLTPEQKKGFSPFMLLQYASSVKGNKDLQQYFIRSANYHANTHLFSEAVIKHHKLQWLMLCASSPGLGKQFHPWIPQIKDKVSKLKEDAKEKEMKDYFSKIYPKGKAEDITLLSKEFVKQQKRKVYLAKKFPAMKIQDIEMLNEFVTDAMIKKYEEEFGNDSK